ncbi:MAG: prolyl oligopeptidase family serine peptidase [Gemmatimonadota bacterium]
MYTKAFLALAGALFGLALGPLDGAAQRFTIEDVLSPAFPYDLVAASAADRIAWLEYERGIRNVYTAEGPDFEPVALTGWTEDDGVDLSGLQISDDGSIVAFIRGHTPNGDGWVANPRTDPGGAERAVWAMHTGGGEPWRIEAARSFTLSPDGSRIAFVWDGQIHAAGVTADEGGARPQGGVESGSLFRVFGENTGPVWSPDGTRIAFVSERDDHDFIGVYDFRSDRVTYMAPGVDRDDSPTWSPDGSQLAFIRRPGTPFGARSEMRGEVPDSLLPPGLLEARFPGGSDFTLWVADVASGAAREVWRNSPDDERFRNVNRIEWAGSHLVFEAEPEEWEHWFAVPAAGAIGQPIDLTPGEGFVEQTSLSPDGRWLYYAANIGDLDRRHLWRVPTGGGEPTRLTTGENLYTFPAALASGDRVATLFAGPRQPQSVAMLDIEGGTGTRVLKDPPSRFPRDAHVLPESVVLTAEDGVVFHSQLFLPPDLRPGERRPALIFIHGGPRRQMLLGYNYGRFYHTAYAMNQYFANKGYIVMAVNYRAGIGYGRSFRTAPNVGRNGMEEYLDIYAAGVYLRDRADVDAGRIGLWGLSYGGILTAQGLARDSDLFAAGVDIAGVHLWGDPLDLEGGMYAASSASEIANWRSPVLLIHGDDDRNVDFSQTVGLVQLLRGHDVPFELIVFPDEVHDFLLYERWLRAFNATDDFFDRAMIRKEGIG